MRPDYKQSDFDLSPDEESPQMPEECPESEAAIEELSRRSLEGKFNFINVIVLSVLLIGCASFFIAMTSSKRYGDEGNRFSLERLFNGKFTAEISRRYYGTIAYPEEISSLSATLTRLYGYNPKNNPVAVSEDGTTIPSEGPRVTKSTEPGHDENALTTTGGKADGTDKEELTEPSETTTTIYETVFKRTTSTTPENPWADLFTTTTTTTTVNDDEPGATATTTTEPELTEATKPSTPKQSETKRSSATKKTDTSKRVTEPPQTAPSSAQSKPPETPSDTKTESSAEVTPPPEDDSSRDPEEGSEE